MNDFFNLNEDNLIINRNTPILVTGSAGFIGSRVVDTLLELGFSKIRCFTRPSSNLSLLNQVLENRNASEVSLITGNLLSQEDCLAATKNVGVVIHLVAGRGKSFPGCFLNSVVTTRNLLEACVKQKSIKRFVNVSSFSVYSNFKMSQGSVFDEKCPLEDNFNKRYDAYAYAKLKQDELVMKYHQDYDIPFVLVRPGAVFGPGKIDIPAQVGINTFGFFLHIGSSNIIPLTYVKNCADAIVLSGLVKGIDGEIFNIVDDDLPTSRTFLKNYKKNVVRFFSFFVPYRLFYLFSFFWENYARISEGQLPPVFNRRHCSFVWKKHRYSNKKLKDKLGWAPRMSIKDTLTLYFDYQKEAGENK